MNFSESWQDLPQSHNIEDRRGEHPYEPPINWAVQDPGGALSLLKYKDAVDQNRSQAERDESIAWLFSYNLDDVRATFAVRDYLRNLTF